MAFGRPFLSLLALAGCLNVFDRGLLDGGATDGGPSSDAGSVVGCGAGEVLCVRGRCVSGLCIAPTDLLAAGDLHSCATRSGELFCWGDNEFSQLAESDAGAIVDRPARMRSAQRYRQLAAGYEFTVGIVDGQLVGFGGNSGGQLGTGQNPPVPVNVSTPLGTLGAGWVNASVGKYHLCGVRNAGDLWCWGNNGDGQLGLGTLLGLHDVPRRVAPSGYVHTCLGHHHSCGLLDDGGLRCWGSNDAGALGHDGGDDASPRPVSGAWATCRAGVESTCAIDLEGGLWCWGGAPGVLVARPSAGPTLIDATRRWSAVSVGARHACALTTAAELFCWGDGSTGALGTGVTAGVHGLEQVTGRWLDVATGASHSCGRDAADGGLWCWGYPSHGQLGFPAASVVALPAPVTLPP